MSEWQPIETAPKDGTIILLYVPDPDGDYQITASWDDMGWMDNARGSWWGFSPSYWKPLSAPPATTSDQQQDKQQ